MANVMAGKRIGLTYDLKGDWLASPGDPIDAAAELDGTRTVEALQKAFASAGHTVVRIGGAKNLIKALPDLAVDIVFNISEGHHGRNRESQVPAILDLYGVPFAGSDALTLGVTLDKAVAKKCFIADGIPTAKYFMATADDDLFALNTMGFPLFVKTLHEGTSKGITPGSRVENFKALRKQVDFINATYKQPALVEEFIKGTEFTIGVIGNGHGAEAMPVVQYAIDGKTALGNSFYTYGHVVDKSVEYICPAPIEAKFARKLQGIALDAYRSVACRDFGRVDFRVDAEGNPYVLEINPLPNLSPDDVFVLFGNVLGLTYEQIINKILNEALVRTGLMPARVYEKSREELYRK